MKELETRYLERLSDLYPTIAAASTEIINLQAILNLPKGTEHFLTDIHGEWEAFSHVLKNGSGAVRSKIEDVFGYTLGKREKQELATLIYYPKEKTEQVKRTEKHMEDWYKIQLYRLIEVSKYKNKLVARSQGHPTASGSGNNFKKEFFESEDDTSVDDEIRIVRTKRFGIKPMYPEDACIQMDLLGHAFFVFCNAETDEVNVVYKRKDGSFGLIEPEFS